MKPKPSKFAKRHVWTRRHIAMLGKISDAALSKKLNLSIGTVLKKRQKLGIAPSRPAKSINWSPALIASLGKIPDSKVARIYRINILSVYKKRVDLGIRCYARKSKTWHYWTKKEIALLGKMPDGDVSLRTGIHKASVAWKRCKLNIPPFTTKRPKKLLTDWTRKEIAVLGKMTDAKAAATLDLAHSAVRLKRIALGSSSISGWIEDRGFIKTRHPPPLQINNHQSSILNRQSSIHPQAGTQPPGGPSSWSSRWEHTRPRVSSSAPSPKTFGSDGERSTQKVSGGGAGNSTRGRVRSPPYPSHSTSGWIDDRGWLIPDFLRIVIHLLFNSKIQNQQSSIVNPPPLSNPVPRPPFHHQRILLPLMGNL
jgi:hypothetical protein